MMLYIGPWLKHVEHVDSHKSKLTEVFTLQHLAHNLIYIHYTYTCICRIIDLIVHMSDEGLLPDNQMLSSVARAIATAASSSTSTTATGANCATHSKSEGLTTNQLQRHGDAAFNNSTTRVSSIPIAPADVWLLQVRQ